jgi:hypothetical protein
VALSAVRRRTSWCIGCLVATQSAGGSEQGTNAGDAQLGRTCPEGSSIYVDRAACPSVARYDPSSSLAWDPLGAKQPTHYERVQCLMAASD